jgi:hypothetical protein
MGSEAIHGAFQRLAADARFEALAIALHIEGGRHLSGHEIVVDVQRATHVAISELAEFARGHGLRANAYQGQVVLSPERG